MEYKKYHFYYSEKQDLRDNTRREVKINGSWFRYTEAYDGDDGPFGNFDDTRFLGEIETSTVRINGIEEQIL